MTTLLTGGFGKTASKIASILHARGIPVLVASRQGQAGVPAPYKGVKFDWNDASTYGNPFQDSNIEAVYLVLPATVNDVANAGKSFIELARKKGVKRFVLMSASLVPKGGPAQGQLQEYLANSGLDYAVLKPSWFFENFLVSLAPDGSFATCADNGKLGLISCDDIAEVGVRALTDNPSPNKEYIIVGPELLTYDEAVEQLSKVLGRQIVHRKLSVTEYRDLGIKYGLPASFAEFLAQMTGRVAEGAEEKVYASPGNTVGKVKLADFAAANKEALLAKLK